VRHRNIVYRLLFTQFFRNAYLALYLQHRSAFIFAFESEHRMELAVEGKPAKGWGSLARWPMWPRFIAVLLFLSDLNF